MKIEAFYFLSGRPAAGEEGEEQSGGHAGEGGRAADGLLPRLCQRHVSPGRAAVAVAAQPWSFLL